MAQPEIDISCRVCEEELNTWDSKELQVSRSIAHSLTHIAEAMCDAARTKPLPSATTLKKEVVK